MEMVATRSPYLKHLFVCVNKRDPGVACCSHGGGEAIQERLKAYVKANGLKGKVRISSSGCMDLCARGPNVMVYPDYRWYHGVGLEGDGVDQIIERELAPLVSPASPMTPVPSPIRAFLFDLGNVLVRFDHRRAAEKIASHTRVSPEELIRLFFESPLVVDHDEGRISTRAFYEGLKAQIGLSVAYEEFLQAWNNIFTEDRGMTALAKRLLSRYPCFLISNTNRAHFEFCRENVPVLEEFTGWILSYEVGVLKPHPAIYQRALELVQVPASCIFYVDDRPDLVEAAGARGFQAHRFLDLESLRNALAAQGLVL
jgi:putative hydrolase of the HAD superfamily